MTDAPSLRELQQWMRSQIRPGTSAGPASNPLNPQRGVPGAERLTVYAEGYTARIREALAEVYEAVHHVIGERAFAVLAETYARRHPSHDYNLNFAGRFLPEFLRASALTERLPFLPDLASLEWLLCRAFHAFDDPPAAPQQFAMVPADSLERLCLRLQPSAGLIASAWPIRDVWAARAMPRAEIDIPVAGRPQRILVHRRDGRVVCELLDERPYGVLAGLAQGRTLGAVCAELVASVGEEELPVAEWFAEWAASGLIASFEVAAASGIE